MSSPGKTGRVDFDDEALLGQIEEDAERDTKNRADEEEQYLDSILSDSGLQDDNSLGESSVFSDDTFSDR